jgi:hypothetical protein
LPDYPVCRPEQTMKRALSSPFGLQKKDCNDC